MCPSFGASVWLVDMSSCLDKLACWPYHSGMEKLQLDHDSPVPLYYQIFEVLMDQIRSGQLPPGMKLPSEPELATLFGVGRPTVRQALDRMVRQGAIDKRRGAGTFVKERPVAVELFSLGGSLNAFSAVGVQVDRSVVEFEREHQVASSLQHNPFAGQSCTYASRVSKVNGRAVLFERLFLDSKAFEGLEASDVEASLGRFATEEALLKVSRAVQRFRCICPDRKMVATLELDEGCVSILYVERTLDFQGTPAGAFAEFYASTESYLFSQVLEVAV